VAPSAAPTDGVFVQVLDAAAGDAQLFATNEAGRRAWLTGTMRRLEAQFDSTVAVLADITGLTFNVEAGKSYEFEAILYYAADATGGHLYGINGTCTATHIRWHLATVRNDLGTWACSELSALGAFFGQAGPTAGKTIITGTITVNAAGTLKVQFAQNVGSGTSSLRRGSTFKLREI
jgi:hypothetical protein